MKLCTPETECVLVVDPHSLEMQNRFSRGRMILMASFLSLVTCHEEEKENLTSKVLSLNENVGSWLNTKRVLSFIKYSCKSKLLEIYASSNLAVYVSILTNLHQY